MKKMKVLVAKPWEIAVRILRACQEMGLPSVAVFTNVDEAALHVRYADEAISIGEKQKYLDITAILEARPSKRHHRRSSRLWLPGRKRRVARRVEEQGLTFIGPRPETVSMMGDKLAARAFLASRPAGHRWDG